MYSKNNAEIEKVVINYFKGIFYGDTKKLEACFGNNVFLYGDIKGEPYLKSLEDYLVGVKERKSPKELGGTFRMKIIGIEIMGNVAVAKLHVPMLGYNYYDYLSLSILDGEWKIVNKLFSHVE